MMRLYRLVSVLCGLAVATAVQAQDIELDDDDLKGIYEAVELRRQEPNDLIDTAAQMHDLFSRRSLLYPEGPLTELVREVGYSLAPAPTDDYIRYRFFVLRDPSPNAFALPNGDIYVHSGMLARLEDTSQLAALLAHEINHVAGHHGILNYRLTAKRIFIQILGGGLASVLGQLRYNRLLEQEADDRAIALVAENGYDPTAMPELMRLLEEDFEGLDPRYATIWTTHPDPEDRIQRSAALSGSFAPIPRDGDAFDAIVGTLREITLRDYLQDDYPYTAIALAERLAARYPNRPQYIMAMADGYQLLGPRPSALPEDFTRRDARRNLRERVRDSRSQRLEDLLASDAGRANQTVNLAQAEMLYHTIQDTDPEFWPATRGLGEIAEARGDARNAARHYLQYLQMSPDAADRPVIMNRLGVLREQLQSQENQP